MLVAVRLTPAGELDLDPDLDPDPNPGSGGGNHSKLERFNQKSGTEADLGLNICCGAQQISEKVLRSGALLGQRRATQPPPHSAKGGGGRPLPQGLRLSDGATGQIKVWIPEFLSQEDKR